MPLQHVGLAGLYGADFQKNMGQFDPDMAGQIERGLSLRGVEVTAALGSKWQSEPRSPNSFARSIFCWPDRSLCRLAACTTRPKNDRWEK